MGSNYLGGDDDDDALAARAEQIVNAARVKWHDLALGLQGPPPGDYLDGDYLHGGVSDPAEAPGPNPYSEEAATDDHSSLLIAALLGAFPVVVVLAIVAELLGDWVWSALPVGYFGILVWLMLQPVWQRMRGTEPLDLGEFGVIRGKRKRRLLAWYGATLTMGFLLWFAGIPYLRAHLLEVLGTLFGSSW